MSWKNGEYADPIVPEGDAVFTILSLKIKETAGGTPFASIMARIDEFDGDYDPEDTSVLEPLGQSAFGSIWFPKEEDELKKALGKQRRVRGFLQVMENSGANLEEFDSPVEVLKNNLAECIGKTFRATIEHRIDENGVYPTKAEINMFRVRRA